MKTVRRFTYAAFVVACLHLVFGAIVRITGSGMGCGPHWPKCYGYWFPPMSRPDLVIEVTHRYLASVLLLSLAALLVAALRHRDEPGVGGRGGVLRPAVVALSLGFGAALLGAVTVKFENAPLATLAHWTVAMSLVAAVVAAVIRAGGLGGAAARAGGASMKARRGAFAAAALALTAVVMGGLTAKFQGAPVACQTFLPFCTPNPDVAPAAVHVQVTHRWIAVLLVLHLVGLFFAFRKRGEAPIVRRAATIALALGILQLLVAGAMIGMHLPPVLRSLHEATGVSIWIATFALAYLARIASEGAGERVAREVPRSPVVSGVPDAGTVRASGGRDGLAAALKTKSAEESATVSESATAEAPHEGAAGVHAHPVDVHAHPVDAHADPVDVRANAEAAATGPDGVRTAPDEAQAASEEAHTASDEAYTASETATVEAEAVHITPEAVVAGPETPAEEAGTPTVVVVAASIVPEVVSIAAEAAQPDAVRRTIFDHVEANHDDVETDSFGRDPFDDIDEADDADEDRVLSLDEEFSRLALDTEEATDPESEPVASQATAAATVPASPAVTGKSTMHHSVAVIISRGADF
jgi:cytochrome c oxidase assembly protein subunit 15